MAARICCASRGYSRKVGASSLKDEIAALQQVGKRYIFSGRRAVLKISVAAAQNLAVGETGWFDQIGFGPAADEINQMMKRESGGFFCRIRVGNAGNEKPRRW
ncbi:hypothetical protein [Rhodoblastus sp.]|uniref:hypothetical protein n=1 Tax=Rhodoblastus sp. TaxID=1962975 RepID=UPI003F9E8FD9